MLSYTDLTKGILFIMNGEPWEVLESHFLRMQQRKAVVQTKIKNLTNGKIVDRNFQPSDNFETAEIERIKSRFLYESRGFYWFDEIDNPQHRFSLEKKEIGEFQTAFLKKDLQITAVSFNQKIIGLELPIKIDFKVVESPPSLRGDTAQGGNKMVVIETGAKVSAPLFINEGDIIRVNTQTGEYVERTEKM